MKYGWKLCNTGTGYCLSPYDGNDVGAWEDEIIDDTEDISPEVDEVFSMTVEELDKYVEHLKKVFG